MRGLLSVLLILAGWAAAGLAAEPRRYAGEQTLWQDTVWDGEVLIDGILTVAPGVTLEIRPGTTVRLTPYDSNGDGIGEHELFIQGRLLALGSVERPVLFTSAAQQPRPGDWGALNMMAAEEENLLRHCRVEYAYRGFHSHFARARVLDTVFENNVRGVQFQESEVVMERCRVIRNRNGVQFRDAQVELREVMVSDNYWGVRSVHSRVTIEDGVFSGNLINGINLRDSQFAVRRSFIGGNRRGLYLQQSQGEVSDNVITGNSEHGILLEQSSGAVQRNRVTGNGRAGVKWVDAVAELRDNDISRNGEYALVNDGSSPAALPGNWWGSVAPQQLATLVRDGADRSGLGLVDLEPVLPGPPRLPQLPVFQGK